MIEQKIDRMVVNVDVSITNVGSTALEVLEKSPGVSVDKDGNISLKGKSKVMVMIDDKPSYLSGAELANLLSNMNSNQLSQIEIMTNPSAKYDAAGNAGVINIKTKKSITQGFNGSVTLNFGQGVYPKLNNSIMLNYRTGNFNAFLNYGYILNKGFMNVDVQRTFLNSDGTKSGELDQLTHNINQSQNNNLKLGLDYFINPKTTVGFAATGFVAPQNQDGFTTSYLKDGNGNITRWGGQLRPDFALGYFYYVEAFGGQVRDPDTQMNCLLGEEKALQALEWIRTNMWDVNCFAQNNQVSATGIPNTWTGVLPANIVAFAERSADQFFALADALEEGSWNISHVPHGPADQASMGAPDIFSVYKGVTERGNQDEVWQFMKWIGAGEWYQDNVATKAGRIPGLVSSADKWPTILRTLEARLQNIELEVVLDQLKTGEARAPQLFRYQSAADELINPAMEAIFVEGKAPVSSLQEAAALVTEAQKAALQRAGGA